MVAFEFATESDVNADFAVQIFEQAGATLQELNSEQRAEFQEILSRLSSEFRKEHREFINSLSENLGLD